MVREQAVRTGELKKRKVAKTTRDEENEYNRETLENIKDLGETLSKEVIGKQETLEEWEDRFPGVFKSLDRYIEYCTLEKCRIETEAGKTIVKKDQKSHMH